MKDTTRLERILARMLGEQFRIQKKLGMAPGATDQDIYGLLIGIDASIDEVADDRDVISRDLVDTVANTLNDIYTDAARRDAFRGYYDLESALQQRGIERDQRWKVIRIVKWLYAAGQFGELIAKMDSEHSPDECRTFDLRDDQT